VWKRGGEWGVVQRRRREWRIVAGCDWFCRLLLLPLARLGNANTSRRTPRLGRNQRRQACKGQEEQAAGVTRQRGEGKAKRAVTAALNKQHDAALKTQRGTMPR